jgi:hypothetical protein
MATQLNLPGIPGGGGIGGALQGLLGSQAVRSIAEWMMLQQLVQSVLSPLVAELQQSAFGQFPTLVAPPAELAAGVVRGHFDPGQAFAEAKKSGYDKVPFQLLLDNAGQPLPLQALLEAWRRQIIPQAGVGADSVSLEQGIRESDLKNKWTPVVEALQWQLANPGVVIEGWLRGQINEAPAREILKQNGIDDATATLMYKSAGRPISPEQAYSAFHRGLMPLAGEGGDAISVRQAFLESDIKNKWFDVWAALAEYRPPPRTVTALLREGVLNDAEAAAEFTKSGLSPALSAKYVLAAHHQKTLASKELTKADILAGYIDGLIPHDQALAGLVALDWAPDAAKLELDMADFRRNKALLDGAVTKVKTLYVARKISAETARDALAKLGVNAAGVTSLFGVWEIERANTVQRLTAAEWATAVKDGLVDEGQAVAQLIALGWTPFEAWVRIALGNKGSMTTPKPPPDVPAAYGGAK